ncbi:polyadenylate-binding protein-interacting protein 10-like [Gossypium australe]|uniref:Polyadenylate-binding protein-interacting protein 10-like n=1 Tax=Gossypium australe TaxID=47621 RepID=A0A5B6W4P5_9ROSI|nr:polyadenylate-binding protein-interacting protein 10-like [Gossypium australe]
MAVAENDGSKIGSSGQNLVPVDTDTVNDSGKPKTNSDSVTATKTTEEPAAAAGEAINGDGFNENNHHHQQMATMTDKLNRFTSVQNGGNNGEILKKNITDLVEILSKLNPMAEEFIPPSLTNHHQQQHNLNDNQFLENGFGFSAENTNRRKRTYFSQGKRRLNNRTSIAQREDAIRKTVYVSDIDLQVTEELLAGLFLSCGPVVDCRICGDPNSVLRFAFVEFYKEEDAKAALNLSGTILGYYPLKVMPSKTAIAPVNPTFLPRSEDEREMCTRTIYCTNIDKKITQADVKLFFESVCGEVQRLRLLGDYHHSTRIAFVEFTLVVTLLLSLFTKVDHFVPEWNRQNVYFAAEIWVSPSKTPVRPRAPRPALAEPPLPVSFSRN